MRKKQTGDVIKLFIDFQREIIDSALPSEKMFRELQMMKFKIKPLQGDISSLNLNDKELIEVLWRLGKLDEFFQKEHRHLRTGDRKIFFQLFDNLHQKYQARLGDLNLKSDENLELSSTIEMEIFKEDLPKRKVN